MPEESQKPAEAAPVKEQAIPEDEDLFEDFAEEEEEHPEVDTKLPLWTADWDDEDAAEDFAVKLKAELQKHHQSSSGTMDTTS